MINSAQSTTTRPRPTKTVGGLVSESVYGQRTYVFSLPYIVSSAYVCHLAAISDCSLDSEGLWGLDAKQVSCLASLSTSILGFVKQFLEVQQK